MADDLFPESATAGCPYVGWNLYFEGCPPQEYQNLYPGINAWIDFFSSKYALPAIQVCSLLVFIEILISSSLE